MTSIEVSSSTPYRVLVGKDLLADLGALVPEDAVAVISDSNVAPLYGQEVCRRLTEAGRRARLVDVAAGESSKSLVVLGEVLGSLAQAGFDRNCAVLALGGGVVTDLAGFAAATYLRGVAYYSCPTTLLGMVDASVGGKTGVNLPEGKNLVGSFWQPRLVLADVTTLASLPGQQFREGAVELFKHGLLGEEVLLGALDHPEFRPVGDPNVLEEYISRSIAVKARIVEEDERESGKRAFLNLGHSLAHALEAASEHRLSHGEAVAYGLLFAAFIGAGRGWRDFRGEARRLLDWLQPSPLPGFSYQELMPYLLRDKKNASNRQRFVLLKEDGKPVLVEDVSESEQRLAWQRLLEAVT